MSPTTDVRWREKTMAISDDAKLQAAATILAAQISADIFSTDLTDEDVLASALASAITVVNSGIARVTAEKRAARKVTSSKFAPMKPPRAK
jgi:hypothetical protein